MKNIAYYNGKTGSIETMMVPMNERACYFGDGVYDATCVVNGEPIELSEHIERFYQSAQLVDIKVRMEKEELERLLRGLVRKVDGEILFLYWQATRGVGMRGHPYKNAGEESSLWAFVRPSELKKPDELYTCVTAEDRRFFYCHVKTLNLLPNVLASQKAEEAGCDEAIFHRGKQVTECAHSNIHILKDGVLHTAPCDELILPGIARAHLIAACSRLGIQVEEKPFTVEEMMNADEVFFSSSSAPICRVREIDGQPVGGKDGQTFARIRDERWQEIMKQAGVACL